MFRQTLRSGLSFQSMARSRYAPSIRWTVPFNASTSRNFCAGTNFQDMYQDTRQVQGEVTVRNFVSTSNNPKPVKGMDKPAELLKAISRLRKYGIALKDFPSAVMIGPQSAGKSSVLEAVCGYDFLVKKMGMATMKPTHVTLINSDDTKFIVGDYEYKTIDEFRAEVERLNGNLMVKELRVEIHAPDVYDCTLIDLPGLYYVSKNDPNMPKMIEKMTDDAVQNNNNILVIAHAGPIDPATNQALQKVQQYDREPDALCVITKVDLTKNQSTELITSMLEGQLYPLGHGYVAVVLRNKKKLDSGVTVAQQIVEEAEYFQQHPQFRPAGVPKLRELISDIQFKKIRDRIPQLIANVDREIGNLKESSTFLDTLLSSGNNQLALRLKMMVEKLVGSSLERAEFEEKLRNEFRVAIHTYMEKTFGEISRQFVPEFSETDMDSNAYSYQSNRMTKPVDFKDDRFKEMFCYGYRAPIVINGETIAKVVGLESRLAMLIPGFKFELDDPLGKKRNAWGRHLERYFNGLMRDGHITREIYKLTEEGLLAYIKSDPEGCDGLTAKFADYVVKTIGSKVYQEKIRFAIESAINAKRRPNISLIEITRNLAQMYPEHFTWRGGFYDVFRKSGKMIKVDVFGDAWNLAYMRAVSDELVDTAFGQTAVNLLEKMVEGVLEMTIDMFNQPQAEKERKELGGKIATLKDVRAILTRFVPE